MKSRTEGGREREKVAGLDSVFRTLWAMHLVLTGSSLTRLGKPFVITGHGSIRLPLITPLEITSYFKDLVYLC